MMSSSGAMLERRPSKRRNFVKRIIPKFLRRRKTSTTSREQHSFVVDDDFCDGDNWSVNEDMLGSVCPDNTVPRVPVTPSKHYGIVNPSDSSSMNSDEISENYANTLREREKRLTPKGLAQALLEGEHQSKYLTQGQGETSQGQSCVGTIKIKLAPDEDGQLVMSHIRDLTMSTSNQNVLNTSNGIYDFPMFGDESFIQNDNLIQNDNSREDLISFDNNVAQSVQSQKAPVIRGWGMVVLEGNSGFSERSRLEDMILSSSVDHTLAYRNTEEESAWGMVCYPEQVDISGFINPFKEISGALWDTLSVLLVSLVFLISGMAVSMVMSWQICFKVIKFFTSISQWATKIGQRSPRTRNFLSTVKLPTSSTFQFKNPCEKIIQMLVKPLGAIFFVFVAPLIIIDGLLKRQNEKRRGSLNHSRSSIRLNPNWLFGFFRMPRFPRLPWTRGSGMPSVPVKIRIGSVWGGHHGGSRGCKCRGGKCTIL